MVTPKGIPFNWVDSTRVDEIFETECVPQILVLYIDQDEYCAISKSHNLSIPSKANPNPWIMHESFGYNIIFTLVQLLVLLLIPPLRHNPMVHVNDYNIPIGSGDCAGQAATLLFHSQT